MSDPLSQAFAALADPTRRDLVARLTDGDATVGQLAAPYEVSVQAISKHLKVLEQAGLISRSRDAQRRPCRIEAKRLEEANQWLERYSAFWEASLQRLDDMLTEIEAEPKPRKRRTTPSAASSNSRKSALRSA